jgi:Protein of unknown function (DUF2807).
MKTNYFLSTIITLCLILLPGCGEMAYMDIDNPEHIKGIVADGPWDIKIYQSETAKVDIEYKDTYDITAEVRRDGYLHLKAKHRILRPNLRKDLKVVLEIPYIEHIKASGACDISFDGRFEGEHCKIEISGASDVKHFEYYGNTLKLDLGGASGCSMNGIVNHIKMSCSGASDAKMYNLITETLDINLSGASDAEITVNERITGKVSGASTLKYRGNADRSEVKSSGASDIKKR